MAVDPVEPYVRLLDRFLGGELAASEFEGRFLDRYKDDDTDWPAAVFEVLDSLFAAADDFCEDPDLRREVGGLDEVGLRVAAATARAALQQLRGPG